ncbi:uncharacterized protein [Agelaius tricolor]|uniref:uncharacterized protein n=1 Tax=Agelaius tricolor TaxID=9191 RepID=UPI0039F193F5
MARKSEQQTVPMAEETQLYSESATGRAEARTCSEAQRARFWPAFPAPVGVRCPPCGASPGKAGAARGCGRPERLRGWPGRGRAVPGPRGAAGRRGQPGLLQQPAGAAAPLALPGAALPHQLQLLNTALSGLLGCALGTPLGLAAGNSDNNNNNNSNSNNSSYNSNNSNTTPGAACAWHGFATALCGEQLAPGAGPGREQRLLLMVMVMVLVLCFLLCWLPYAAGALLATFGQPGLISLAASIIPAILAKSSTVYNPSIYVFLNKQFYRCFVELLRCNKSPQSSLPRLKKQQQTPGSEELLPKPSQAQKRDPELGAVGGLQETSCM